MEKFLTLREFIDLTGVYVTPVYYKMIEKDFKEQRELTPNEFIVAYVEENNALIETTKLSGEIKYFVDDELYCDEDCLITELLEDSLIINEKLDKIVKLSEKIQEHNKKLNLINSYLTSFVGTIVKNELCNNEINQNEYLKTSLEIVVNQITLLTEEIEKFNRR